MADVKYRPVAHDHEAFLKKASKRKGFRTAYEEREEEYRLTTRAIKLVPTPRLAKRPARAAKKQAAG